MAITHAGPGQPPGIRRGPDGLTDKQRAIVDCIARSVADRGYPPSMREIGQAVGLTSTSSVAHQFLALECKGALRRDRTVPRLLPPPQVLGGRRGRAARRLGLLHTVAVPQLQDPPFPQPGHGLPLELRGHRDLTPGKSLGLILLKSPDNTATLQLRYDRFDYLVKPERAEVFAAIRRRISTVTGEAPLPAMLGCSATG